MHGIDHALPTQPRPLSAHRCLYKELIHTFSKSMKLSELYREKIALLNLYVTTADACEDVDERRNLNEAARHSQHEADYIAHCLAYFGDQDISALLGDDTLVYALALPCRLKNPWSRGLYLLRQAFAG